MSITSTSIWGLIRDFIADISSRNPLSDALRGPAENSVSFTIAIIALTAKMAKADGRVTRDEVRTLRQIFVFDERDEKEITRVFDLARQDVTGFEIYAKRIANLFHDRHEMLKDIFESLFVIAVSDGEFHQNEELFLEEVAKIFDIKDSYYHHLRRRYLASEDACDAYEILGIESTATAEEIKIAYRQIIRENHPDALRAKGLPDETIALAEMRVRAANQAYEALETKN